MGEWIGVVGTLAGVAVGGLIAAYMSYREQQREPKLLMLDKRIDAYSELYGRLYWITDAFHRRLPALETKRRLNEFQSSLLSKLLLLDQETRTKVLAAYNQLMHDLDAGEVDVQETMKPVNDAMAALFKVSGLKYT